MVVDVNKIRPAKGGDPEIYRESERKRGRDGSYVDLFLEKDDLWVKAQYETEQLKAEFNATKKSIGARKKIDKNDACGDLVPLIAEYKEKIAKNEELSETLKVERSVVMHKIGNPVDPRAPVGSDENKANETIRTWGDDLKEKRNYECDGTRGKMHHNELMEAIEGYNMQKGAEVAGHRGYYLLGPGAEFNQALLQYGQKFLRKKGYTTTQVPFFMKQSYMSKAAELADFEETLYRIPAQEKKVDAKDKKQGDAATQEKKGEDMFLIATSEQPLCCLHANETLEEKDLPKKYCGISTCFRKEAGSHGKDNWGIFRVHQFEKIEQFVVCKPEDSKAEHEKMIGISEEFMQSLGLPYRVISICAGALNDAAALKYDLEAWFPGYSAYRELVSCSNCTDFQSRGLNIPYGYPKQGDREREYTHLLNGTLCASQRTLCCIIENYQTPEGIIVPEVLRPFMDDKEFIPFTKEVVVGSQEK